MREYLEDTERVILRRKEAKKQERKLRPNLNVSSEPPTPTQVVQELTVPSLSVETEQPTKDADLEMQDDINFGAGPSHELTSAEKDLLQTEMNFDEINFVAGPSHELTCS